MKETESPAPPERLALNRNETAALLGISLTSLWRLERTDPTFPRAVKIGGLRRWLPDELRAWLRQTNRAA